MKDDASKEKKALKLFWTRSQHPKKRITPEVLEHACRLNPNLADYLNKWKRLFKALEKLTDGEAAKVINTVKDENGFET